MPDNQMDRLGVRRQADRDLLIRNDERIKSLEEDVEKINARLDTNYVTVERFRPVQWIAFSIATAVTTAVGSALLNLIIKSGGAP